MKCGQMMGCHTAKPFLVVYGLDLVSPNVASRLVGVMSAETGIAPMGTLLINPTNPSQSAIYTKVTANSPYGERMPFGLPLLDSATQMCILEWVTTTAASARAGSGSGGVDAGTTTTDSGMSGVTNGG